MSTPSIIIVTAADTSHFGPVQNLCWLLARFEPAAKVILYDLGLTAAQLKLLNEVPPFALKDFTIRTFDFSKYPDHLALKNGNWAWKPVIIADTVTEFGDTVWMDAGNFFYQPPVGKIKATLVKNGFYSPLIPRTIRQLTHPDTLRLLQAEAVADQRMRDACVVGINSSNTTTTTLVEKWKAAALDKAIIAPEGSNKSNHRGDESVLSILAYQSGLALEDDWFWLRGHCDWMGFQHVKFQITGKMS